MSDKIDGPHSAAGGTDECASQRANHTDPDDDQDARRGFAPGPRTAQAMHAVAVSRLAKYELVTSGDAAKLHVPLESLRSLQRTLSAHKLKTDSKRFRKSDVLKPLLKRCIPQGDESIVDTALSVGWSPYLLARAAVARAMGCEGDKKALGALMRNPSRITDARLRQAAQDAMDADPFVSPAVDAAKARVGALYEVHLEALLSAVSLPFSSESSLRELGAAKTPDVLLNVPIGVVHPVTGQAILVNWVDSKALFGDATTHMASVMPQAQAYANRYGPGIIVYWLGCESALCHADGTGAAAYQMPAAGGSLAGAALPSVAALPTFPRQYILPGGDTVHSFKLLPPPVGSSEEARPAHSKGGQEAAEGGGDARSE